MSKIQSGPASRAPASLHRAEKADSGVSSCSSKGANPSWVPTLLDLNTPLIAPKRLRLQIPLHWESELPHRNWRDTFIQ